MKWVVDASVAIKWAVEEDGRRQARALILQRHDLLAPDFLFVEIANVLWKKMRRGELPAAHPTRALQEVRLPFARLLPTDEVVSRALEMATEIDHPVYDCLYLAAAERADCAVVTADRRFLGAAVHGPYAGRIADLAEVAA